MAQIQHGPNGPQNVLIGPYGGAGQVQYFQQSYQPQQAGSNCGTPSIASLQMV